MSTRIDKDNYVTVLGWMVTDLHLKGNELLTYAIIYGFCKEEGRAFTGSIPYLMAWLSLSYRGVLNVLQSLVEKGHLIKSEGDAVPSYSAVEPSEKSSQAIVKKLQGPPEKTSDNIDSDIDSIETDKEKDTKVSQKKEIKSDVVRFIPPTVEMVREYCTSRGNAVDAETFVDFYQSKGWLVGKVKMKDWKAAVRTWERERVRRANGTQPQSKVGKAINMLNEMGITEDNSAF